MLTQQQIDKIFSTLRIVHKAHWKPPKIELVQKEIERTGKYVFRIGSNPWVAEVIIENEKISYEVNRELPERMRKSTEELKKQFELNVSL